MPSVPRVPRRAGLLVPLPDRLHIQPKAAHLRLVDQGGLLSQQQVHRREPQQLPARRRRDDSQGLRHDQPSVG